MKRFMKWLSNSFAPAMKKIVGRPWISAVSTSMQKIIPFILAGSIIFLYGVVRDFVSVLPDIGIIADFTFGMIGLIIAFMLAHQVMINLHHDKSTINAGLVSIAIFLININPTIDEGIFTVEFGRLGPTGILVGILSALLTAAIFNLYGKLNLFEDSEIPDFVTEWINTIIPILVTVGLAVVIAFKLNIDIFDITEIVFSPLQSFAQTLPGFILVCLIPAMFYSIGISSWFFGSITTPIFLAGIAGNIALVEQGLAPTNIVTSETVFTAALITMGGMGATLGLNFLMLFSKSKKLKVLGKICIIPSFFNINEPVVFSTPVVMNPLLMLPMWINAIIGPIVIWLSMSSGFLNIPARMIQIGQIPAPFSSVMITEDMRAIIVYIILFFIYLAVWYPFFKVYEKQVLTEEKQAGVDDMPLSNPVTE
ncbi:PTS sugar transporter subunit IIC [Amphibacillus sp. Q70]|uniref:PTS sugar transporter subunit IIC n=1 Tax=Amphibacillus sp. Q70 TaxID=3453416 RepID=UPI003F87D290